MHEIIRNMQAEIESQRKDLETMRRKLLELTREMRILQEQGARQANATTTLHARLAVMDRTNELGLSNVPNRNPVSNAIA